MTAPISRNVRNAERRSGIAAESPSYRDDEPDDRGAERHGQARKEIRVYAVLDLDHVRTCRDIDLELADGIGAHIRRVPIDGRAPTGVEVIL